MITHQKNLITVFVLIIISNWGYFSSSTPSFTALIPAIFGLLILAFNKGVKQGKKSAKNISIALFMLVLIGLLKPLTASIGRESTPAIIRVLVMMAFSIWSLQALLTSKNN